MRKFEIGKTYSMKSPCDHNCEWIYKVIARTACTVTLVDEFGKEIKCRISKYAIEMYNEETVYPLGKYSMCPSLTA